MQKNKISILLIFLLIGWASCKNELDQKVSMDVRATAPDAEMDGDTLVIKLNQAVTFNITGNPDFITFYSGEAGHEYSRRNQTQTPVDEIESCNLNFTALAQYGLIPNTLKVFLSTSYEGMIGGNKEADSLRIEKTDWLDITAQCNLPTVSNGTANVSIPLKEYLGKELTVAFLYDPNQNTLAQPTWEMQNIKVANKSKLTGITSDLGAVALGFQAFNMYATGNTAYVASPSTPGVWGIKSDITLRISSSPVANPIRKGWMISKSLILNSRMPDTGVGIKSMADNPVETYGHYFEKTGTYTVTFIAKNANFEYSSEVKHELYIKVIE